MVDTVIQLFDSNETKFLTNGLGSLFDASKCEVTEERNGSFELEMEYPLSGKHYSDLQLRRIIVAKANPYVKPQPFRIYEITKPMNGIITVKAEHISYDMTGYPVSPFTSSGALSVMSRLNSSSMVNCPFRFTTDLTSSSDFNLQKPISMRSLLGGSDGSILDTYGGEYEFDGFQVILHSNRGKNRGVTIRYGKNMTDLKQEENCSNVYTAVYPFWYSDEWGLIELPEKIIPASGSYDFTRVYPLDLSGEWENSTYEWEDEYPTEDEIREMALNFVSENKIGIPSVSLTVSFEQLSQSGEYAALDMLETVRLCDIVNVEFPKLGVKESSKCIKTTYNVLTGKYSSIELGETSSNLANAIVSRDSVVKKTQEDIIDINNDVKDINKNVGDITVSLEKTSTGLIAEVSRATEAEGNLSSRISMTADEIRLGVERDYETKDGANTKYAELSSSIQLTAESIKSTVKETYETKGDASANYTSLQSSIEQSARDIKLEVDSKYAKNGKVDEAFSRISIAEGTINSKVSKGDVVSEINQSPEEIIIKSNRLTIESDDFNLRNGQGFFSGNLSGASGSFSGEITANSGKIGNFDIIGGGLYSYATQVLENYVTSTNISSTNGMDAYTMTCTGPLYAQGAANTTTTNKTNMVVINTSTGELKLSESSSKRYKHDITPLITEELNPERLYYIPINEYVYNADYLDVDDPRYNKKVIGIIAEEVEKHYPIAAEKNEYGETENWNDRYLIPPMLSLIQKQHKEIEKLKSDIAGLSCELFIFRQRMEELLC